GRLHHGTNCARKVATAMAPLITDTTCTVTINRDSARSLGKCAPERPSPVVCSEVPSVVLGPAALAGSDASAPADGVLRSGSVAGACAPVVPVGVADLRRRRARAARA